MRDRRWIASSPEPRPRHVGEILPILRGDLQRAITGRLLELLAQALLERCLAAVLASVL